MLEERLAGFRALELDVLAEQDVEAQRELGRVIWVVSTPWWNVAHEVVKRMPGRQLFRSCLCI
jgi:hypothetical protein